MAAPTVTPPRPAAAADLRRKGTDVAGGAFKSFLIAALVLSLVTLVALIWDMSVEGSPVLGNRLGSFLTSGLSTEVARAGVWQGLKGSLLLGLLVVVIAFPVGIGAAVYLEEYAAGSRFANIVNINIRNLAGVPSIVYGLLGLAIFVQALGGATGGRTVLSGGLTLSALVLPIVIITSQEALRAVPAGIREGALALGATRWETIRHHVIAAAAPGILTGTVLSLARALGEAAPLLVIGAVTGVFFTGDQTVVQQLLSGRFTAMPMVIFNWARQPGPEWLRLTGAASLILVALIVAMNGFAIYLRNRYERKW